jgi:Kef-type K+ transport system membrane component KefB
MESQNFIFFIFWVFTGAALLGTLALYTKQSLLVAYIILGMLLGPSGFKLVPNVELAHSIGDVGIIFLLFLLGLDLTPRELMTTLRKTTLVTVVFSILFVSSGFAVGYLFDFALIESLLIGASLIFSSTIIGLKLLPTLDLHYKPIGDTMVSILLLQDLLAIVLLLLVQGSNFTGSPFLDIGITVITLPILLLAALWIQHQVIAKLFAKFERVSEYVFLLALAWCLGLAELANQLGLSSEVGAFIAGVSIAEGPIALFIANNLKPLRDFCLTLFFFATGASFSFQHLPDVFLPAFILAALVLFLKPWLFGVLLHASGEKESIAKEVGIRLGQASEFSLLISYLALKMTPPLITPKANYLIQAVTILTFIVSSYWVALRYPTPLALEDNLLSD